MKKRLSINRIAGAGIRANKRAYVALSLGIWLALFIVCTLCLCVKGAGEKQIANFQETYGSEDIIEFDTQIPDSTFAELGLFDRIGHAYVTGCVTDTIYNIGWYDDEGTNLLNRKVLVGRMPENASELAIEKSAFLSLGYTDKDIGSTIELSLTPISGTEETHSFTLVGMLNDQSAMMSENGRRTDEMMSFPALLTGGETAFSDGRTAAHVLFKLKKGIAQNDAFGVLKSLDEYGNLYGLEVGFGLCTYYDYAEQTDMRDAVQKYLGSLEIILFIMLASSLALAACIGIAGAMESRLASRTEEIGMLRAVGATRKQIRQVFGRESWLLALAISPVAIASACLAAWIMSRVFPEVFMFTPEPVLLIPAFVLSVLCILLSCRLPLRRASKQLPMGVLRDTALLRKARSIRTKREFRAPNLLAARQLRLHPGRQIGSILLIGLLTLSAMCAFGVAKGVFQKGDFDFSNEEAFHLYCYETWDTDMEELAETRSLTEADILEIRSLPGVSQVLSFRETSVFLHWDSLPDYLRDPLFHTWDYLLTDEEYIESYDFEHGTDGAVSYQRLIEGHQRDVARYNGLKKAQNITDELIKMHVHIISSSMLKKGKFSTLVRDGEINFEAIDQGREVLVLAPDMYFSVTRGQKGEVYGWYEWYAEPENYDFKQINNMLYSGDELSCLQILAKEADYVQMCESYSSFDEEDYAQYYRNTERYDAAVTIGAVLNGLPNSSEFMFLAYEIPTICTTDAGAKAMGIDMGCNRDVYVYVEPGISEETENYLYNHIEAICSRSGNYQVTNSLKLSREERTKNLQVFFVLISCTLLFFCVAVAMITGNVTRRIRADARMIGTLRAVGADRKVIAGCYKRQVLLQVAAGAVFSIVIAIALAWLSKYTLRINVSVSVPIVVGFCALCYLACQLLTDLRVREVLRSSIIENIREL